MRPWLFLLAMVVLFAHYSMSSVTVKTEGIIYRPTLQGDKQLASRRVPLIITPDFPMLSQFTENFTLATSASAQLTLVAKVPFAQYRLKKIGCVAGSMSVIKSTVVLVDDFKTAGLVREADNEILQRLASAIAAIPTSFVTNRTLLSNTNASAVPVNPVERLARSITEQNDTTPQGPFGRRLLQESSASTTPVTLSEILATCANGLSEDFASTLMTICNQTSESVNGSVLTEAAAREEIRCLIAGACLAKVQCSAPGTNPIIGVDEPCQQAVLSQFRADVALMAQAEQTRKLAFYQSYLTSVAQIFEGFINLSSNLSALVDQQTQSVNETVAILQERREMLGNMSTTLIDLQTQQDAVTELLAESIQQSDDMYTQRSQLILDVIDQVEALNTINANLKLILRSAALTTQKSDLVAKLHLVSQTQAAALSNNIMMGLSRALRDFVHKPQVQSQLARQTQALFLQQESGTGKKLFSPDRGEHPRVLSAAERYQRVFATSFSYVRNATLQDVRRAMVQVFCDIQKFLLDDGDARGTMAFLPDLIGPSAECSFSESLAGDLLANLSQPSVTYSLNVAAWAFAQFRNETSGLSGCKCFAIATETIAVNASLAVSYVESTTAEQALYFHNITLDRVFNVSSVEYVQVLPNKTSWLSYVNTKICSLTGEPYSISSPVYTTAFGVPVRIETEGFDAVTTYLSSQVDERLSCDGDPKHADLWVQPALDAVASATPLPLILYQHWLMGVKAIEPWVELARHLWAGRLPDACRLTSSAYEYVAESMGADKAGNVLLSTDNTGSAANGSGVSEFFYNSSTPFAFESHTLTCAMRSINCIPIYQLYDKQVVVDGRVELLTNAETFGSRVVQTKVLQAPMDLLPWQMHIANYGGCFRTACPLQPIYMDPNSGWVMGALTARNGSYLTSGLDPTAHLDGSDPSATGYELFMHDIPEDLFSGSPSLLQQRGRVTATMDRTLDEGSASGINSLSQARVDTHEGPIFQYRTQSYYLWEQSVLGKFDPEDHASVGLQLFRQRFTFGPNDTTPLPTGTERLPYYTSAQCTANRKSSASPGLCNYLDHFHMDFSPSQGTVTFYPIVWDFETILDVVVANDNASVPLALRPAALDAFGRRVNNCPSVDVQHLENEFTHVYITYGVLPETPRVLEVTATACDQEAATMTGEFHRNYTVGTTVGVGDFRPFATLTIGVPGCSRQLLIVTVIDPDGIAARNACASFEAPTRTLSAEVVRQESETLITVQNDQQSRIVRDVGFLSSFAPQRLVELAERALADTFAAILNEQSMNESLTAELNDTSLFLEDLRTAIEQSAAQLHSLGLAFLDQIPELRAQFAETRLKADEVVAFLNNIAETEAEYRELQAQAAERNAIFARAINLSSEAYQNLSGVQFIFANAPANFAWDDLGFLLTLFANITCPATLDAWEEGVRDASDQFHCTDVHGIPIGLNCLNGELTFVRYLIYGFTFSLGTIGLLYITTVTQYGLKLCPKSGSNAYKRALWASSSREMPNAASYVRPLVVLGIGYVIGAICVAFL